MMFWVLSLLILLAVIAPLVWVLLRRKADTRASADFDIAVYRDQLRDIDRDLERGVIEPETAERTRLEISRRILDADRTRQDAQGIAAPKSLTLGAVAAVVVVVVGGTFVTYRSLGAPGYEDLPLEKRLAMAEDIRANRMGQSAAEARVPAQPPVSVDPEYQALVDRLRTTVQERPDDPRGLQLLAQNEANLGNFIAAHEAQSRLLEIAGDQAPASAWAELAEFQIMAAGGYVSPEAEDALRAALSRDETDGPARYYWGLMRAQTGRPDLAFSIWRGLLEDSPSDAPWTAAIRAQILEVAHLAGQRYDLPAVAEAPAALPGPTAEDMAAAQDMSAEDRQVMIQSMVDGLADRLATDGGPAPEWARLISALGVLGQSDRAAAIYAEAQGVFAQDPQGLAAIETAAAQAGLK